MEKSHIIKPVQHSVIWSTERGKNELNSEENCVQLDLIDSILVLFFVEETKSLDCS